MSSFFDEQPEERPPWHKTQHFRVVLVLVPFVVVGIGLAYVASHQKHAGPQQAQTTGAVIPGGSAALTPYAAAIKAAAAKTQQLKDFSIRAYDKEVVSGSTTRLTTTKQIIDLPWSDANVRFTGTLQRAVSNPSHLMRVISRFAANGNKSDVAYVHYRYLGLKPSKSWLETSRDLSFRESTDPADKSRVSTAAVTSPVYLPQPIIADVLPSLPYLKRTHHYGAKITVYSGEDQSRQRNVLIVVGDDGYIHRVIVSYKAQGDRGFTTYVRSITYYGFGQRHMIAPPPKAEIQRSR